MASVETHAGNDKLTPDKKLEMVAFYENQLDLVRTRIAKVGPVARAKADALAAQWFAQSVRQPPPSSVTCLPERFSQCLSKPPLVLPRRPSELIHEAVVGPQ